MIDQIDGQMLELLQDNARVSNADIARRVGMAPSGTFERMRKLEERGVVKGYAARLDPKSVGLGLLAFVFVRSADSPGASHTGRELAEIPEVLEVHNITGEDCFLLKLRARDPEDLARILRDRVGKVKSVTGTRTTIALETLKETTRLPLEAVISRP